MGQLFVDTDTNNDDRVKPGVSSFTGDINRFLSTEVLMTLEADTVAAFQR